MQENVRKTCSSQKYYVILERKSETGDIWLLRYDHIEKLFE